MKHHWHALGLAAALTLICGCTAQSNRTTVATFSNGALKHEAEEVLIADAGWLRHGRFESWREDGSKEAQGHYQQGKKNGSWTFYFPNGSAREQGAFAHGEKNGPWKHWLENGELAAQGSYLSDLAEGVWVYFDPSGAVDSELTGVYENGQRISSWFEKGIRSGTLNSGIKQQAEYSHGLRNGRAVSTYPSGEPQAEGNYENGLRTGPWTFWNRDGQVDPEMSGLYRLHVRVAPLSETSAGQGGAQNDSPGSGSR